MILFLKHRLIRWAIWLFFFGFILGLIVYVLRLPQLPPDISQLS
jgi:hypothetical protein